MKAIPPTVSHKAASGLVKVGLSDEAAVGAAWQAIAGALARLGAVDAPVIVQPMVRGSHELIAGFNQQPGLGDFLLFGLGGVLTEILDEVSLVALPVSRLGLAEALRESRTGRFLMGKTDDIFAPAYVAFEKTLWRLCMLVEESGGAFGSIDINPLIATDEGCIALDRLMVLAGR